MPTLSFFQLLILLLLAFLLFGDIAKLKKRVQDGLSSDDSSSEDQETKQKKLK